MSNISSNYQNLFGSKVQATAAAPAAAAPTQAPTLPPFPSQDSVSLSAAATNAPPSTPETPATAQATPAVQATTAAQPAATAAATGPQAELRAELEKLQKELLSINEKIEGLMKALDEAEKAAAAEPATPAEKPAETSASGGTHKVKAGDYLWKIAAEKLGDASRWTEIYELNKDKIGDNPNLIYPGLELKLPGASTTPKPPADNKPPANDTPPAPPTPPTPPANPTPTNPTPPAPPAPPTPTPPAPPTNPTTPATGTSDVPATGPSNRQITDQDVARIAQEFGLAADRNNVLAFLDEMDSYEGAHKGKVFGPGMEALAANGDEGSRIKQSVMQIQQALNLLLKAGKLNVQTANGQRVTELPLTGTFFKVDAQGKEIKDGQGNPQMDEAFIAAITQFKQKNGIHQNYKLADGSYAINEYVGPGSIEKLKAALLELQG